MFANSSANTTSTNSSVLQCPDYRDTHRLHMVVYSLVLATGLPLNALALWVFLRVLRVHSVVSVYMYGSCLFLMLINVDRYAAIVHPLRLRHLRRPRVARRLCLGVWALILLFAVPAARVHSPSHCTYKNITVRLCFESFGDELWKGRLLPLLLLAEILGFLLPLAAVVYSSGRVFWTLARPDATQSQRRRKTVRLLLANLIIFLLCFVPYNSTLAVYGLLRANLVKNSIQDRDLI